MPDWIRQAFQPLRSGRARWVLFAAVLGLGIVGWLEPDLARGETATVARRLATALAMVFFSVVFILAVLLLGGMLQALSQTAAWKRMSTASSRIWGLVVLFGLGLLPLFAGFGILCWQAAHWLYDGYWTSIDLLDFMVWANLRASWAQAPDSWFGLWRLLDGFPVSLAAILYGGPMTVALLNENADTWH